MASKAETAALVEQHKAAKEEMSRILGIALMGRGWCPTIDEILHRVGLKARAKWYRDRGQAEPELTGEPTVEEFDAWKVTASRELHREANDRSIEDWYKDLMDAVGLYGRPQPVRILVKGTFEVPYTVEVFPGEEPDLTKTLPQRTVRDLVYNNFHAEERVSYEASVAEPEAEEAAASA